MTFDGGPPLRRGRRNPQNLYLQLGEDPADTDPSIGWSRSTTAVAQAITAVNVGVRPPGSAWWASGCLVYLGPGAGLTTDWALAVDSPETARRIVAAANGVTP